MTSKQLVSDRSFAWGVFALQRPLVGYLLVWTLFIGAVATLVSVEAANIAAPWWRWTAVMLVSWWLPGILLLWRWPPPGLNGLTAALFVLGLGLCWQITLLIALHWLPGPLPFWLLIGVYVGSTACLLLLCRGRPFLLDPVEHTVLGWMVALLLVALLLRVPVLDYNEFHQDETHLLRRANEAIRGEDDALARHTKGIGEIAMVMVVYRGLHTINEATARLPFAITSVGSILALAILGMRLFHRRVGLMAGLLLGINGFALGLSRIVQYQGVVLLLSVLVLLAMWEFYQRQSLTWLALALLLSAFGLVMHYEFLLMLLPTFALLVAGWYRAGFHQPAQRQRIVKTLILAGGAGVSLVVAIYLPLLLHPYFATTRSYMGTRVANFQANNIAFLIEMATFYNSIYFVGGMAVLLTGALVIGLNSWRWPSLLLIAWALPAALLYLFVVQYPGTHFYLIMPGLSLLAALTIVTVDGWLRRLRTLRWTFRAGILLWLALSTYYLYLLFFQQSPAYLDNYSQSHLPIYWAPYGDQVPEKPRFGFPIHQGWKTLGLLADWQYLGKTYSSNERSDALRWYLRAYDRVAIEEDPDYVFVARRVQERDPTFDDDKLEAGGYQQIGAVRVHGEPQITIWAQLPPSSAYLRYVAAHFAQAFDRAMPTLREEMSQSLQAVDGTIGSATVVGEDAEGAIKLINVAQPTLNKSRRTILHLVFSWEVLRPLQQDYKLFVHLTDTEANIVAQWDGLPGQNTVQTTAWQAGAQPVDHVLIPLPADLPKGTYTVRVGFYDPATGQRLGNGVIEATTITVG